MNSPDDAPCSFGKESEGLQSIDYSELVQISVRTGVKEETKKSYRFPLRPGLKKRVDLGDVAEGPQGLGGSMSEGGPGEVAGSEEVKNVPRIGTTIR